jgi:RNA polymerase sigma-70 factor (ECF subfamily)
VPVPGNPLEIVFMSLLMSVPELSWIGALLLPLVAMAAGSQKPHYEEGTHPDHELVRATLDGDATAYRGLVERYETRIYHVCYGMVRNREDARDMAQDAFIKAYKNLGRFRFQSSFYTWICRIAMNVCIDHLRKQKVRRAEAFDEGIATRESGGLISMEHHRNNPSKDVERKRLYQRILAAMDELPELHKQVIVLREMEGLAYKEIAEVLEIPEGTVMSRLYYARKRLQAALKEERE